ncbi:methylenetetrahydrofolate reductase [Aminobacter ciceronei]|uniref:Methylenetetrahydrofolate reductase (NADPH) n=2 Tax=Aminobacter ciceronei TaxID=150723 RepID=A0ABR6CBE4_9HYPH|nr:methylenetetrahydrofolate reductase [Aminobacter ciceronei]MBA8907992.1 methylenetetrahydrofolate reductase (NADPH) [Aminobacter ciceronei]MBA9021747.1 methylenetetrahydrofolate reductase (NADPH) [Aminobacter ciceronei]
MCEQTNAQAVPVEAPRRLLDGDLSIELSSDQVRDFSPSSSVLPQGSRVFLTHLTGKPLSAQIDAAARLRDMGYLPVPHLGARNFNTADDYVRHVESHSRNGVTTALFVGGNPLISSGPLTEAAQLLAHPVLRDSTIRHAFIGGYPEGHPAISQPALEDALRAKIALSSKVGLSVQVVSQFAFDGAQMGRWAQKLHSDYPGLPVRVGLAGVTSLPKLIKFAVMCGIGPSLAALKRSGTGLFNVLAEKDPGDVIEGIEATYPTPVAPLDIHFFPFGGWTKTLDWIAAARSR